MKKPKIRFTGFNGDWERIQLSDILSISNEQNKKNTFSKEDVFSVSDEFGVVNQIKHLGRSYAGKSLTGYKVLRENQIVYTKSPLRAKPYGIIKVNELGTGIVSVLYGIYNVNEGTYPKYIDRYFEPGYRTNNYLLPLINKGAKNTINISDQSTLNGSIYLPIDIKEQKAICNYLETLDNQIQSTTKKIETLKQVKAASLQSMFPQEGETTPRVRFKGFEGEWETVQFSKLYEPSSIKNKTFGADKIISVANMYFKPVSYISDEEYLKSYNVMNLGDIAFEGNKSKDYAHGRFVENTIGDGIVSHVFIVLKPISKQYDLQFWKYLINYERIMGPVLLRSTKHSTMMTDLVVSDFLKESILVPSYEEQKAIGAFFENLDIQITLQRQRLEKLKQIKSACLDNMFV